MNLNSEMKTSSSRYGIGIGIAGLLGGILFGGLGLGLTQSLIPAIPFIMGGIAIGVSMGALVFSSSSSHKKSNQLKNPTM